MGSPLSPDTEINPGDSSDLAFTMAELSHAYPDSEDGQEKSLFGPEYHRERKGRPMSPRSKEDLRLKINHRERQRMHDLNSAMDALRQVHIFLCLSFLSACQNNTQCQQRFPIINFVLNCLAYSCSNHGT